MSSDSNIPEPIYFKNYRDLIRRMVGGSPGYHDPPWPTPPHPSIYYDGTNDRAAFDRWLHTLLLYFRASDMLGGSNDDFRVSAAAGYLEGVARDWFFVRVAAPGSSIPYKFEEVVIEMARVFVTFGTQFLSSPPKYVPGTTARAFWFQLQHWKEMDDPTATKEQRDPFIRDSFVQGMYEAMLEMDPGEHIERWYDLVVADGECSEETMLNRTQYTLDKLKRKREEAQEKQREGYVGGRAYESPAHD